MNSAHPNSSELVTTLHGRVKWFDRKRGFGFIVPDDGSQDILIHCTTIVPHGRRDLPENAIVICECAPGPKGRHVERLVSIDLSEAQDFEAPGPQGSGLPDVDSMTPGAPYVLATVKWFSRVKGYGFVTTEQTDQDIFLHMEALRDARYGPVTTGDRFYITVVDSNRGPAVGEVFSHHRGG